MKSVCRLCISEEISREEVLFQQEQLMARANQEMESSAGPSTKQHDAANKAGSENSINQRPSPSCNQIANQSTAANAPQPTVALNTQRDPRLAVRSQVISQPNTTLTTNSKEVDIKAQSSSDRNQNNKDLLLSTPHSNTINTSEIKQRPNIKNDTTERISSSIKSEPLSEDYETACSDEIRLSYIRYQENVVLPEECHEINPSCDKDLDTANSSMREALVGIKVAQNLQLLSEFSNNFGVMGNLLPIIYQKACSIMREGKEPLSVFDDDDNVTLLALLQQKLPKLKASSTLGKESIQKVEYALQALIEQVEISNNDLSHLGLDINAIARGTQGYSAEEIAKFVHQILTYEDKPSPTAEQLHFIGMAVAAKHFQFSVNAPGTFTVKKKDLAANTKQSIPLQPVKPFDRKYDEQLSSAASVTQKKVASVVPNVILPDHDSRNSEHQHVETLPSSTLNSGCDVDLRHMAPTDFRSLDIVISDAFGPVEQLPDVSDRDQDMRLPPPQTQPLQLPLAYNSNASIVESGTHSATNDRQPVAYNAHNQRNRDEATPNSPSTDDRSNLASTDHRSAKVKVSLRSNVSGKNRVVVWESPSFRDKRKIDGSDEEVVLDNPGFLEEGEIVSDDEFDPLAVTKNANPVEISSSSDGSKWRSCAPENSNITNKSQENIRGKHNKSKNINSNYVDHISNKTHHKSSDLNFSYRSSSKNRFSHTNNDISQTNKSFSHHKQDEYLDVRHQSKHDHHAHRSPTHSLSPTGDMDNPYIRKARNSQPTDLHVSKPSLHNHKKCVPQSTNPSKHATNKNLGNNPSTYKSEFIPTETGSSSSNELPRNSHIKPLTGPFDVLKPIPRNPYFFPPPPSTMDSNTANSMKNPYLTLDHQGISKGSENVVHKHATIANIPASDQQILKGSDIIKTNFTNTSSKGHWVSGLYNKSDMPTKLPVRNTTNIPTNKPYSSPGPFNQHVSNKTPLLPTPVLATDQSQPRKIDELRKNSDVTSHSLLEPFHYGKDVNFEKPTASSSEPKCKTHPPLMPPPHIIFSQPPPLIKKPLESIVDNSAQLTSSTRSDILMKIKKEKEDFIELFDTGRHQFNVSSQFKRPVLYSYTDEISVLHNSRESASREIVEQSKVSLSNVDTNQKKNDENLLIENASNKMLPPDLKFKSTTEKNRRASNVESSSSTRSLSSECVGDNDRSSPEGLSGRPDDEYFMPPINVCPTPVRVKPLFSPPRKEWKPPESSSIVPPPSPWQSLSLRSHLDEMNVAPFASPRVSTPTHMHPFLQKQTQLVQSFGVVNQWSKISNSPNSVSVSPEILQAIPSTSKNTNIGSTQSTGKSVEDENDNWNKFLSECLADDPISDEVKFCVVEKKNEPITIKKEPRFSAGIPMEPLPEIVHLSDQESLSDDTSSRPSSTIPPIDSPVPMESPECSRAASPAAETKPELPLSIDTVNPASTEDSDENDGEESLNFQDMVELLRNFSDLDPEEQNAFSTYLRNLKEENPEAIEKLYACANVKK